jgi:arginase family enzyme
LEVTEQLQGFVENKIFPAMPVMLSVDHSATMGVISALAAKYKPEELSVIVLDQHFDALPLSLRVAETSAAASNPMTGIPPTWLNTPDRYKDQCCCGNFWAYLIDKRRILPENLSFIGVADYPARSNESTKDNLFQKSYLNFEERGCSFFPIQQFEGQYLDSLTKFIGQGIKTPHVYVSLDLDVGSYSCTWAARYMDRQGICAENLLDVVNQIRNACQRNQVELIGFDITEFNMHFLGLETGGGVKDSTLQLVGDFIGALTAS